MKKYIDNLMEDKKKFYTSGLALLLLVVMIVASTYAYFKSTDASDSGFDTSVSTNTTDSLVFETGGDISITANPSNFNEGMGNQSGSTFARATLRANNKTNQATAKYFVYLDITENEFRYSYKKWLEDEDGNEYSDKKPELLLKITEPNGNEVTECDYLEFVSVIDGEGNNQSGFDITELENRITIAENYEINSTGTEIQEWKFEVMFVNLNIDQQINGGKNFNANLIIKKENSGVMKEKDNNSFWQHSDKIKSIVFESKLIPKENAAYTYDVSLIQDGSVMAYLIDNGDETFTTYIQGDGEILANENSTSVFLGFRILEDIIGISNFNVSLVKDMSGMFASCENIVNLDLSSWNTSNVTNMNGMFYECKSLEILNLSNLNTSNVESMSLMFSWCNNLIEVDLEKWNVGKVSDMYGMFSDCYNLVSIGNTSHWNTSSVKNMNYMFSFCNSLTDLNVTNWDTSNVTDMAIMFQQCNSLTSLDLSSWNTAKVTNMISMFDGCSSLISLDVSSFDTSQVTDMDNMFSGCSSLTNLDFRNAIFTGVSSYSQMFENISSTISVIVKDNDAKTFIEARLNEANGGTVTIA